MSKQNGREPAYPGPEYILPTGRKHDFGMTKRETIAMHLMAGLLASEVEAPKSQFARKAVECADALLEALE